MKKFLMCSILLASLLNASSDVNKTEVYMQKYLPHNKIENYNITPEELRVNTMDLNLTDIKSKMDVNQSKFNEQFGTIQTLKSVNAESQAREVSNYAHSSKFQKEVIKNEDYILYDKSIDWSKYTGQYSQQTKQIMEQLESNNSPLLSSNRFLNGNEKLFIVISSSIPKETIKNYFKMLEPVNTDVTFVLRGVIGSPKKIMPTIHYINELLVKDDNRDKTDKKNRYSMNVEINPKITRRFNVKKVPAVLFIENYNPVVQEYKDVIGKPDKDESYWIAYGATSIDYALERINKKAKSKGIKRLLKAMNTSFYNKEKKQ